MKHVVATTVLIALVLALAPGCTARPAPRPLEPLTIAVGTLPHYSLIHVAHVKGFFARQGLAVTLQPHAFGKLALDSLLDGKADLATCAETPVVFAELRGQRVSVLASIGSATRSMAVVARRDAGVDRPSDLAGKRIAVTPATSGAFFLDTFLLRHGLTERDVHLVNLAPGAMGDALASGAVDAAASWNPTVFELQHRLGARVRAFYEQELYSETALLVGRHGFGREHPEAARRVLRALLEAEALFREHPAEARRAVAQDLGEEGGLLDQTLGQFVFEVRLDQGLLVLMEEEDRWARRLGPTAGRPADILELLDPAPLLAVEPGRVGLIR